MVTAFDVALYILDEIGSLPAMKLHRLVYYCQALHLVWDGVPLFQDKIEAWANGVVIPTLYYSHQGTFYIEIIRVPKGNPPLLVSDEQDTCAAVIRFYGDKSSQWLKDLVCSESPWLDARRGMSAIECGCVEITHDAMVKYYGSL